MGIMDIIKSPSFIKGAVKEGISIYDKAEEVGQEGLENLKIARKEVAETIGKLTEEYKTAQTISDRVGGGAFGKYLFKVKPITDLAALSGLTESSFNTEMSSLKADFDSKSDEEKERISEFDVQASYDADVADAKVRGNLVRTNNIGESTGKLTLAERMTSGVRAGFDNREKDIIDSVGGGTLRDPSPIEGGFESISSGKGEIPYLLAGEYGIEYQKLKNDAEKGFADYLKSNKFKVDGTNMYLSSQKINEVGNLIFPEGVRDGNNIRGLSSQEVIQNVNTISELSGISPDMVIEDILKQKYLDRTYGGTFKYLGVLEMIDKMDKAAEAYEG
tara:strand:+ start:362 stop:1357 length:996 start_codon:yes stop_codon:yes gene_type:complete